jgi:hypothetical protein
MKGLGYSSQAGGFFGIVTRDVSKDYKLIDTEIRGYLYV